MMQRSRNDRSVFFVLASLVEITMSAVSLLHRWELQVSELQIPRPLQEWAVFLNNPQQDFNFLLALGVPNRPLRNSCLLIHYDSATQEKRGTL
jgi:hypothetical protein